MSDEPLAKGGKGRAQGKLKKLRKRLLAADGSFVILSRDKTKGTGALLVTGGVVTPEEGGALEIDSDLFGYHSLTVPPEAVSRSTFIVMKVRVKGTVEVAFAPKMEFDEAVELVTSYREADLDGIDEAALSLFYDDVENGAISEVPGSGVCGDYQIRASLWHFSRYIVGSDD